MSVTKRLQNLCIAALQAREMPTRYLPWEPLHARTKSVAMPSSVQSSSIQNLRSRIRTLTVNRF